MDNYIQIVNNGYNIKISLENLSYEDIPDLLEQIQIDNCNWWNFWTDDKLWYCDENKYLTCIAVNHNDNAKVIIFEAE